MNDTKITAKGLSSGKRSTVIARKRTPRTVRFGAVTVEVIPATRTEKDRNIREGQVVLTKLLKRIQKPGVKLSLKKDVPIYYADPDDPRYLLRRLRNTTERVRYSDGDFVVCK